MSEEKKLLVIATLKRLKRPCTTLDLAKGLGMSRKEANPLLYAFQSEGLIKKVHESNPPMWDLTPSGQLYGTKMKESNIVRGRGRGLLGLSAYPITPGGMDTLSSQRQHQNFNAPPTQLDAAQNFSAPPTQLGGFCYLKEELLCMFD